MLSQLLMEENSSILCLIAMKKISLLQYSFGERRFWPGLFVRASASSSCSAIETAGDEHPIQVEPSHEWMEEYESWHEQVTEGTTPVFKTLQELNEFNLKGKELALKLEGELGDSAIVEPYRPLYSNITVGDVIYGWWHARDENYGFPVCIQKIPVSDELKSDFQAWRFKKMKGWLDHDTYHDLNEEGHKLEERIRQELNLQPLADESNVFRMKRNLQSSSWFARPKNRRSLRRYSHSL